MATDHTIYNVVVIAMKNLEISTKHGTIITEKYGKILTAIGSYAVLMDKES